MPKARDPGTTEPFNALLPGSAGETRVSPRGCWGRIATLLLTLDCIDRLARDAIATIAGRMIVLHGRLGQEIARKQHRIGLGC